MSTTALCPYCRDTIGESVVWVRLCPSCSTPHHTACFEENGGCTVFGCSAAPPAEPKLSIETPDLHSSQPAPSIAVEAGIPLGFVKLPPNLHWGWVLAIEALTRGSFQLVWGLIQANWARKLSGKNTPMVLSTIHTASMLLGAVAMALDEGGIGGLLIFVAIICRIASVFSIRHAMEDYYNSVENIGLSMGGGMTFFFGVIYIQYHINRIARWKNTGVLS
jgi:hypothetical protein